MQGFQELYSHTDKNSGRKSEDMFLVKIASKGTSLKRSTPSSILYAGLFMLRLGTSSKT